MPTVLRIGPYRFFFYAGDRDEPCRIHVERNDRVAKFWLDPCRLQNSGGFSRNELNKILAIIIDHQDQMVEMWHEYFGY